MKHTVNIAVFIFAAGLVAHWMASDRLDERAYEQALRYFNQHQLEIENAKYLTVIDFTKPSFVKRMHIFNLETGEVERHLVAHGQRSGHTYARHFSNEIGSHRSCRGFFITGEKYEGEHGTSLRLQGKEQGINDNAFRRDIVIHGADWVSYRAILENGGRLGRSWGCPAVPAPEADAIAEKLKDGRLLYIYVEKPGDEQGG